MIEIEKALNFIRDKAKLLAQAKANRVYLEQFRKSKKAILSRESGLKTAQEREAYAYAHDEYLQLLDGLKAATEEEELLKYQIRAAELKIEVWRSRNANERFERKSYGA